MEKINLSSVMTRISDPDIYLTKIKDIPANIKIAFVSSVIFTLIIHGVVFTTKLINEDGISSIVGSASNVTSGRWFIPILDGLTRGWYRIPWIIGIYAILALAFSVVMIVSVLKIRSKSMAILISLLVVSFPSLSMQFGYLFMIIPYIFSLMFAVGAVWLTQRWKFGFLLGGLSLMLSMALYQSYVAFTIGLFLILILKSIFEENMVEVKYTIEKIARSLGCGIFGVGCYVLSVRISTTITGIQLSDYKGIDEMTSLPLNMLPALIRRTFLGFFAFFGDTGRFFTVSNELTLFYAINFLLIAYFLIRLILLKEVFRNFIKMAIVISVFIMAPFGINIVDLLGHRTRAGILNTHPFVLVFILSLVLCEIYVNCSNNNKDTNEQKKGLVSKWIVLVIAFLICTHHVRANGVYYFKLYIYNERTTAFYNRLLDRIETLEGFRSDIPIAVIGNLSSPTGFNVGRHQFPEIINDQGLWGQYIGVQSNQPRKVRSFISDYLGVDLTIVSDELLEYFQSHSDVVNMPFWPHRDSVAIVDETIIIRLGYVAYATIEQIDGSTHLISSGPDSLSEDLLYSWYIYREGARIETIEFTQGLSSFEHEFNEPGRYRVRLFINKPDFTNSPDGEPFIRPSIFSDWFIYEPQE